jgi:hypothetical protein
VTCSLFSTDGCLTSDDAAPRTARHGRRNRRRPAVSRPWCLRSRAAAGTPDHEQIGFGDLGQLVQLATDRRRGVPAFMGLEVGFSARALQHLTSMLAVVRHWWAAPPAKLVGLASEYVRDRQLPVWRDKHPGKRDRVAAALLAIDTDHNVPEHRGSS